MATTVIMSASAEIPMLMPEEPAPILCPTCAGNVSLDPPYFGVGGKWYCCEKCAKIGETAKLAAEYYAMRDAR